MTQQPSISQFIHLFNESAANNSFVKLSLGNYKGRELDLKNIYIQKIQIKGKVKFSFTYRFKTRDIVKNYSIEESNAILHQYLSDGFRVANLFTIEFDCQLEHGKDNKILIRKMKASHYELPPQTHDRNKKRHIEANSKSYLHDLGITNADGQVYKNSQEKFKQINHYIELMRVMLDQLPKDSILNVVDMGSGKGYLTFALYDYLLQTQVKGLRVTGVEFKEDMVTLCNEVAIKNKFNGLHFVQGSIQDFDAKEMNIMIALHACDTATDDAIFKGIQAEAELIVVAPCCHKQIRKQIELGKKENELDFILRHGIFLEREAAMITDSLRALILEYAGYKTKVFEFVSEANTPKNIMIVAEKLKSNILVNKNELLSKIKLAKDFFGISKHHLEGLLNI